ncbi:DUF3109 domain-containing protein [Brevibacillus daliensis]|uniref:DUF3109 domain-containing protein n=1 Tax=Brevibacillus daliensis TaxID=2892995 RepID=UPI001E29B512|nr:DUF3109 domain-containing protein [Brevibacillus daliensis]
MRQSKLIRYYGTTERMTEKEAYRCEKYLKRNQERIITKGRFLIDGKALNKPYNLDCFNCHLVHRETCCENGQPYAVEEWQIPLIEKESAIIAEKYFNGRLREKTLQSGCFEQTEPGVVRMEKGSCMFYGEVEGKRCCYLHANGVREEKDVYSIKPFSCQLYPIDLIEVGDHLLITALTEETASFSRWGSDYLEAFYCANLDRRKHAHHIDEKHFAVDDYQSAYYWGKELIIRSLGQDTYDILHETVQENG